MAKPIVNYVLDWGAFVLFTGVVGTGSVLRWTLPPGSGGASVLGMTRHEWGSIHFWVAVGLLAVVLVHLLLHAAWIKAMTAGKSKGARTRRVRVAVAIGAVVLLLAFAVGSVFLPVSGDTGGGHGGDHARGGGRHAAGMR